MTRLKNWTVPRAAFVAFFIAFTAVPFALSDPKVHCTLDVLFETVRRARAQPGAIASRMESLSAEQVTEMRGDLVKRVKREGVPAFYKRVAPGRELPVVLVDAQTYGKMQPMMDHTIGPQVVLQPDWNNDHGSLHILGHLIDVDTPGARGFGEINRTGLAWKPLGGYLQRREQGAYTILETAFAVTPEEARVADYYHRVRRGALVRVKFTFTQVNYPADTPGLLQRGGEHCFVFCKASAVRSHVEEIASKIKEMGIPDVRAWLAQEPVQKYLDAASERVMAADVTRGLAPDMLERRELLKLLEAAVPANFPKNRLPELSNWVIGYDASAKYQELANRLGFQGGVGIEEAASDRALAIFVYTDSSHAAAFRNGSFTAEGKFSRFGGDGTTRPLDE